MTALHGFLGLPADWNCLDCTRNATKPDWMPLLARTGNGPALWSLAEQLNDLSGLDDTLLGYSMGGRIALHMLARHKRWRRAVIVSASPGPSADEDRATRLANDLRWADRFKSEDWTDTVAAWNAQTVFAKDSCEPPTRLEKDFKRDQLASALVLGSVAGQEDLRKYLPGLDIPVLWIAGENDAKYCSLATECAALNPLFELKIISGSGHRVPWTHPNEFCHAAEEFLDQ